MRLPVLTPLPLPTILGMHLGSTRNRQRRRGMTTAEEWVIVVWGCLIILKSGVLLANLQYLLPLIVAHPCVGQQGIAITLRICLMTVGSFAE